MSSVTPFHKFNSPYRLLDDSWCKTHRKNQASTGEPSVSNLSSMPTSVTVEEWQRRIMVQTQPLWYKKTPKLHSKSTSSYSPNYAWRITNNNTNRGASNSVSCFTGAQRSTQRSSSTQTQINSRCSEPTMQSDHDKNMKFATRNDGIWSSEDVSEAWNAVTSVMLVKTSRSCFLCLLFVQCFCESSSIFLTSMIS